MALKNPLKPKHLKTTKITKSEQSKEKNETTRVVKEKFCCRDETILGVTTFFPICDQLLGKLRRRKTAYEAVTSHFAFLGRPHALTEAEIVEHATTLHKAYPEDLSVDIKDECLFLKSFLLCDCSAKRSFSVLKRIAFNVLE
ncbi:hypothetical protein O0L34_g4672 [Tuta absoluta]|nr:hypothetical protein O0L34_g4672 [Tuta absoluta]